MIRIRYLLSSGIPIVKNITEYYQIFEEQFISIFLPNIKEYVIVNENEQADICLYSVQLDNEKLLRDNEINIFISVENLEFWGSRRGHYKFYNTFNKFNSKLTNIYIHNDEYNIIKKNNYISYPTVYFRLNYFNKIYKTISQQFNIKFAQKRFCLAISRNYLNDNKQKMIQLLSNFGQVDHISKYDKILHNKSCYNSIELLKVFSHYKFILCFENSHTNGYITEKIFNVFLARSIPIYDGAPNINTYISNKSYIPLDNNLINNIIYYSNETTYNNMINEKKVICDIPSLNILPDHFYQ